MFETALTRRAFALGLALSVSAPAYAKKREAAKEKVVPTKLAPAPSPRQFAAFIAKLWPDAQKAGVSRETFDAAFHGVKFEPKIVAHTIVQAEFVRPIWSYLDSAVSAKRIENGRAALEQQRRWVEKAASDYGVDVSIVMGIWGIETGYGSFQGSDYVIGALASLALSNYQPEYFRGELISALTILENGDVTPQRMIGSWAGAMGQTQFMPSSYLKYAVDFDGGGKRDIWGDAADAIGSTANYLAEHGWTKGQPWGFEVTLPEGFALTLADTEKAASFSDLARRGVARADGESTGRVGEGRLMILAGLDGPIFFVTGNFNVIKTYNNSTSYALAVALLGDRILGRGEVRAAWPVGDRQLTPDEVTHLQTRLKKIGYDAGKIDGRNGASLQSALRHYQADKGLAPDGYATPALFAQVMGGAGKAPERRK